MNVSFYTPDTMTVRDPKVPWPVGATLTSLLALDDLAQVEILAGSADRRLTAAVVVDSPRPQNWLRGGELVVTTGSMLAQEGTSWIDGLAEGKAAGVLALIGRECSQVPSASVQRAQEHGLLLLGMPAPADLTRLISTLARAIEGGSLSQLRQGLNWQRALLGQAIDGAGFEEMARAIAAGLGVPVLVEDRQFNLLAAANPGPSCEVFDAIVSAGGTPIEALKTFEESGVMRGLRSDRAGLYLQGGAVHPIGRHIHPVAIGDEIHGYISILEVDGQLADDVVSRLATASTAIAVEFLKQGGVAESEQKMRRDFFRDLLFANYSMSQETLHRRATYLGYALSSSYWALVVEFDAVPSEDALSEQLKQLVGTLNSLLSFRQALVVSESQGATILYPVKEGQPSLDKLKQLAETIRQKVNQTSPGWTVSIGIGQLYNDLLSIPKSYREAGHAVKIGRALKGPSQVHGFADLGIYRMLLQFASSRNPSEFFCDALERLLEYDQQADKELVKTLAAFLECNGNLTETSERLYIHRNTLKYRLERIRDITQIDLDDSENRLILHLGLKMHQILSVQAGL